MESEGVQVADRGCERGGPGGTEHRKIHGGTSDSTGVKGLATVGKRGEKRKREQEE